MDQGLWQPPESIDFIYSSYMWIQTIWLVQTHGEATVYVKELDICVWLWMSRKHVSSIVVWKVFRWKRIFLWMGQWSKNHISSKTGFGYFAIRRISFLFWFQGSKVRLLDLNQNSKTFSKQESHSSSSSSTSSSSFATSEIQIREREVASDNFGWW